jgi:DNA replication protein DnaC
LISPFAAWIPGGATLSQPYLPLLLIVIEERHGLASTTIVAAQLPIDLWHENIRDPTIADAILDRLVHNVYQIKLKEESMRKTHSNLTNTKEFGK